MNTLHMNNEPSTVDMANNLENFELKLAQQQIVDLEQQAKAAERKHFDELAAVKKGQGVIDNPISYVIDLLQSVPANQALIVNQQESITELTEALEREVDNNVALGEKLEEVLTATRQIKDQRDQINSELGNAVRQLNNDKTIIKDRTDKLKELNALNPKKLQAANKALQAKNKDLNEANAILKKQRTGLKGQYEQLEKDHSKLQTQKKAVDAGFAKLHEDINSGAATDVLQTIGDWQICSHATRHDAFYIVDTKTDIVRPYFNGEIPKARPIPQGVKDATLVISERNKMAAKNLGFMQDK